MQLSEVSLPAYFHKININIDVYSMCRHSMSIIVHTFYPFRRLMKL